MNDNMTNEYDNMTYDKMSMTKSHGAILVNVFKWVNKWYTLTNQIRVKLDNINVSKININ